MFSINLFVTKFKILLGFLVISVILINQTTNFEKFSIIKTNYLSGFKHNVKHLTNC